MSEIVWCDLSATVCGAEYLNGMPAARVRAKDDGWVWTAWNERGKRLGLGGGYAKVGGAMAAAERQIDVAAQAVPS